MLPKIKPHEGKAQLVICVKTDNGVSTFKVSQSQISLNFEDHYTTSIDLHGIVIDQSNITFEHSENTSTTATEIVNREQEINMTWEDAILKGIDELQEENVQSKSQDILRKKSLPYLNFSY